MCTHGLHQGTLGLGEPIETEWSGARRHEAWHHRLETVEAHVPN